MGETATDDITRRVYNELKDLSQVQINNNNGLLENFLILYIIFIQLFIYYVLVTSVFVPMFMFVPVLRKS